MKSPIPFLLLAALAAPGQTTAVSGYPAPPAGAPSAACSLDNLPASSPVRILLGPKPIPYAFACGQHTDNKSCIGGKLDPGLVVSVGATSGAWSCVSGGDSTSGWVPTFRLAELPTTPQVPLSDWIGWWRNGPSTPFAKNDRLLITRSAAPGVLHISGRAYWYGGGDNVHFGGINADAQPVGPYLHVVGDDTLSGCILDLHFNPAPHTFSAYDNANCGGMNVRFSGTWSRFTPTTRMLHKESSSP
jgi:hypothetical protein